MVDNDKLPHVGAVVTAVPQQDNRPPWRKIADARIMRQALM